MTKAWLVLLACVFAAAAPAAESPAQPAGKEVSCKGNIVDETGAPISAARVIAFRQWVTNEGPRAKLLVETASGADGTFSVEAAPDEAEARESALIVAWKEGYALMAEEWPLSESTEGVVITLAKPAPFAGTVTDETGAPVAAADVRAAVVVGDMYGPHYLFGVSPLDMLAAKSDARGRFSFGNLPAEANVEYVVSAPGRATVFTGGEKGLSPYKSAQDASRAADMKVVLPPESRLDGVVVDARTGAAAADVTVAVSIKDEQMAAVTAKSAADGTFSVGGLGKGTYVVSLAASDAARLKKTAAPVKVELEEGKSASGVRLELGDPAGLEVRISDVESKAPVKGAFVEIKSGDDGDSTMASTGENGVARFDIAPGEYTVSAIYAEGCAGLEPSEVLTVTAGKVAQAAFELKRLSKVHGVILDEAGKPAEGAQIRVAPLGIWEEIPEGSEGKFEVEWNPGSEAEASGYLTPVLYVIATLDARNLAAIAEVKDFTAPVEIRLAPAATLAGKVVDAKGAPVAGATVDVLWQGPGWVWSVGDAATFADDNGRFEMPGVPKGSRYVVKAGCEGYGPNSVEVDVAADATGTVEAKPVVLPKADLGLSGVVVDAGGKPVKGAEVKVSRADGYALIARTDAQGKFSVAGLVAGNVQLEAAVRDSGLYGVAQAGAGATDVKIMLAEQKEGRPAPVVEAGAALAGTTLSKLDWLKFDEAAAKDKMILLCVWDANQRPSRHYAGTLAQRAADLEKKGVVIISVDTSGVDDKTRAAAAGQLGIKFPVLTIAPENQASFKAAGINRQPFLVLTDRAHIVRASDFSLDDIDARIAEVDKKAQ